MFGTNDDPTYCRESPADHRTGMGCRSDYLTLMYGNENWNFRILGSCVSSSRRCHPSPAITASDIPRWELARIVCLSGLLICQPWNDGNVTCFSPPRGVTLVINYSLPADLKNKTRWMARIASPRITQKTARATHTKD